MDQFETYGFPFDEEVAVTIRFAKTLPVSIRTAVAIACSLACARVMKYMRGVYSSSSEVALIVEKADGTIQMAVDRIGARLSVSVISSFFPDESILIEDAAPVVKESSYTWYGDPVDGSRRFEREYTDPCAGFYCLCNGSLIAGAIIHPAYRKLVAGDGETSHVWWVGTNRDFTLLEGVPYPINLSEENGRDVPFFALDANYISSGAKKITHNHSSKIAFLTLLGGWYEEFHLVSCGSNLGQQFFVLTGMAEAGISDTIGGPQDVLGCLLILLAGGFAVDETGGDIGFQTKTALYGRLQMQAFISAFCDCYEKDNS